MRFVGRGHPNIRAGHGKTLEITADAEITTRATCVVAVAALAEDAHPVAGPILLTIRVDGTVLATVRALGNPLWDPTRSAVVRRSAVRLPDTVATCADTVAADLPTDAVAALTDPAAVVEIDVEPAAAARPAVVLLAAQPHRPDDPALLAELAAAGRVVAEDAAARRLTHRAADHGDPLRTLVVAARDLPGRSVVDLLRDAECDLDVVGLSTPLAVAAASASRAPLTIATDRPAPGAIRTAPAAHRLVVRCRPDELPTLAGLAADLRPSTGPIVLAQDDVPPVRWRPPATPPLASDAEVHLCLPPAQRPLDPTVVTAVRDLLADGVSTRTAARALATLTGLPRRDAYDAVLGLSGD